MPLDYKKEYRAFYQPPKVPEIIDVPEMQFTRTRRAARISRRSACCTRSATR